jgi:hypothetical protein
MNDGHDCDVCGEPWWVRFEWSYTSTERYCRGHLLDPIDGQPGKTLLDYMPDCQQITMRDRDGFETIYVSTAALQAAVGSGGAVSR